MSGHLNYFKVVNGAELSIDQPWSFSCNPGILNVWSKNYTMDEDLSYFTDHLHQRITAPNSQITILDGKTGEEFSECRIPYTCRSSDP